MNIEYLRDFLCVAETTNLTMAAELRHTTQSNLSKRIRSLETWLARELIDRSSRPLTLTADGENFVAKARSVLTELEAFRRNETPWSISAGAVRIAMPHSGTVQVFPEFKRKLLELVPEAYFAPRIANHDMVASILSRSECDLALVNRHPDVPQAEEFAVFRSVRIARDRLVLVSPTSDLHANLPIYVSHRGTYLGQVWQRCKPDGVTGPEIEMGMAADIRAHCLAGSGRGVLPHSTVEADLALGRLFACDCPADLGYDFLLYCAPKASPQARKIWSIAAEHLRLPSSRE